MVTERIEASNFEILDCNNAMAIVTLDGESTEMYIGRV